MVERNPPSASSRQGIEAGSRLSHLHGRVHRCAPSQDDGRRDRICPGKKITWQLKKGVRLPVWLSLELADDDEGVAIEHTIRAGFQGVGRILDTIFRIYLSEEFARDMDDHVKTEFVKLEDMLHR